MITATIIKKLFNEWVTNENIFLVDVRVTTGNKVTVLVDRLDGLKVTDCVNLSRFIEGNIDREKEDFELNVSSPGADSPFLVNQQYIKNTGRNVKLTDIENIIYEGVLKTINDEGVFIEIKPKKKLKTNETEVFVPFQKIKETKVIISFK